MGEGIVKIMMFSSLHEFFYMEGQGFYVWLSYLVSIFLLIFMAFSPLIKKARLFKSIRRRTQLEEESIE